MCRRPLSMLLAKARRRCANFSAAGIPLITMTTPAEPYFAEKGPPPMTVRAWTVCCGVLTAGALAVAASAWAQAPDAPGIFDQAEVARIPDQTPKQDGVEPLARGPVHEAFVEFARTKLVGGPVIAKKPPALLEEMPPAEKPADEDTQWICGYWSFDE